MVDWRRGWGQSVMKLHWCSCLTLIYGQLEEGCQSVMKIIQCNGLLEIHAQLTRGCQSAMDICALCYI